MLNFLGAKSERWLKTKLRSLIIEKEKQQLSKKKRNEDSDSTETSPKHSDGSSSNDPENEVDFKNIPEEIALTSESTMPKESISPEKSLEVPTMVDNNDEEAGEIANGHDQEIEHGDESNEKDDMKENNVVTSNQLSLDLEQSLDGDDLNGEEKIADVVSPVTESAEDALNYISCNSSEGVSEELNDLVR